MTSMMTLHSNTKPDSMDPTHPEHNVKETVVMPIKLQERKPNRRLGVERRPRRLSMSLTMGSERKPPDFDDIDPTHPIHDIKEAETVVIPIKPRERRPNRRLGLTKGSPVISELRKSSSNLMRSFTNIHHHQPRFGSVTGCSTGSTELTADEVARQVAEEFLHKDYPLEHQMRSANKGSFESESISTSSEHSGNGNHKSVKSPPRSFKIFSANSGSFEDQSKKGPKTVHFAPHEVQPLKFQFDWSLAPDVWFTRAELGKMNEQRFDDAATLRKERESNKDKGKGGSADDLDTSMHKTSTTKDIDILINIARARITLRKERESNKGEGKGGSVDDLDMSMQKTSTSKDVDTLINIALEDKDLNPEVSIRGIEHFVYPELQQEMIRKKKEARKEVLEFVTSKRPDPQGWRLAAHCKKHTQWARDVAREKGQMAVMKDDENDDKVNLDGAVRRGKVSKSHRKGNPLRNSLCHVDLSKLDLNDPPPPPSLAWY